MENSKRLWMKLVLIVCLFSFLAAITEEPRGVLEPESANEARLNRLQPPDKVMDAIGVKPGMRVAEIGAGRGRYVVQLAVRVGETGKVYAEDIDAGALKHLEERCRRWGLDHVEPILGEAANPKLPEGELDLIFIISSYHHFNDPVVLLRHARSALKPDGILAIGEWLPKDNRNFSAPKQMEAQMKAAGYKLERMDPLLKKNNMMIYIFSLDSR